MTSDASAPPPPGDEDWIDVEIDNPLVISCRKRIIDDDTIEVHCFVKNGFQEDWQNAVESAAARHFGAGAYWDKRVIAATYDAERHKYTDDIAVMKRSKGS